MTRQVHDIINIPIPKMQSAKSFKNVAAYGKDSFVYDDKIGNLSKFDDNLEVLEAYDGEEDEEGSFCLCGKVNDDKMIMCGLEE